MQATVVVHTGGGGGGGVQPFIAYTLAVGIHAESEIIIPQVPNKLKNRSFIVFTPYRRS